MLGKSRGTPPCESLWRTKTSTPPGNWVSIFSTPGQQVVRTAVGGLDIYYAGTSFGDVFAGPSGSGWQLVFTHPDGRHTSDFEIDPRRTDALYASFALPYTVDRNCASFAGTRRIYQLIRTSSDPAVLTMVATEISTNLPPGLCVNAHATPGARNPWCSWW